MCLWIVASCSDAHNMRKYEAHLYIFMEYLTILREIIRR